MRLHNAYTHTHLFGFSTLTVSTNFLLLLYGCAFWALTRETKQSKWKSYSSARFGFFFFVHSFSFLLLLCFFLFVPFLLFVSTIVLSLSLTRTHVCDHWKWNEQKMTSQTVCTQFTSMSSTLSGCSSFFFFLLIIISVFLFLLRF